MDVFDSIYDEEDDVMIPLYFDDKGNRCRYVVVKGRTADQLADYEAMKQDLKECLEYLALLVSFDTAEYEDDIPMALRTSLFFSMIIKYAKCFTANEGGRAQLQHKHILKDCEQKILDLHDTVMSLRSEYVAHRDDSDKELAYIMLYLNPDESNKEILHERFICYKQHKPVESLADYLVLVHKVFTYVHNKIAKLKAKYDEELHALGLDEIYTHSKSMEGKPILPMKKLQDFFKDYDITGLTHEEEGLYWSHFIP